MEIEAEYNRGQGPSQNIAVSNTKRDYSRAATNNIIAYLNMHNIRLQ